MQKKQIVKGLILLAAIGLVAGFFLGDFQRFFSLAYMKSSLESFQGYYARHRVATLAGYMGIYIVMAALSLPGATVMSLFGGALFGLWTGVVMVSFASTIGASLAFLVSRFLFRDYIQDRFRDKLKIINQGVESEGGFYLFTLRLVPLFPFFVINLVMGLTPISLPVFYGVSQLGMFPATVVYINAGTQLARIDSLQGILSPGLVFAFVLLGLFPLLAKKLSSGVRSWKALSRFKKPARFDYNMVVIGGGSAGLVASLIAAAVKARVALIEAHRMGGDCLNTGCVPSKALLRSAKMLSYAARAREFGFRKGTIDYEFSEVMDRVHRIIRTVEPHDSAERFTGLGVECIKGLASVKSPWEVEVNGRRLTTRSIIIATGARPMVPDLPGLAAIDYLTSDTIWKIRTLPGRLLVLGGGPIGCELSQAFARLGSRVTLVQRGPRILKREDPDVADFIRERLVSEGVRVLTGHAAREIRPESGGVGPVLVCDHGGQEVAVEFDTLLLALGRTPVLDGLGLEDLGVRVRPGGTLAAGDFMETNIPTIFCAGDVAGPFQFTHTASHQAWYASVNALFGRFKKFRVDYRTIPWATYTDPEVARVGLSETEAKVRGIACEVTVYGLDDLDRAIVDSEAHGFVKVLTPPKKDTILGVTIVGSHASTVIAEFVLAMKHGLGLNKILGTIHIYPTLAEANKYAAGAWKKAHIPVTLLSWIERFHTWMRH
ncbi:MAG: FAD-dependent oxidoreductase [Pseudomonadota bacterium]